MAGVSRDQVVAGRRALLFTLYPGHHGETDNAYAFIHVLSMRGGVWCLEVPAELDLASLPGVAAVSPDESTLYAVSANGWVAEYRIDDVLDRRRTPAAWRVVRPMETTGGHPSAVVTDEHLIVAGGGNIRWLERQALSLDGSAESADSIEAITATPGVEVIVAAGGDVGLAAPGQQFDTRVELPPRTGTVTRIAPTQAARVSRDGSRFRH
jgi:hypothetical protein